MGAHAFLAGAHQVNRHHPLVERDVTILEDRPDSDAESLSASRTLPQARTHLVLGFGLGLHPESLFDKPAMWAHGAIGPQLGLKERNRALFGTEILG
jgi:hypothetical protein